MKLISMTDFVLELLNQNPPYNEVNMLTKMSNYANFLKQPIKLSIFTPCDKNDLPLQVPENYELWCKYGDFSQYGKSLSTICRPYFEAKESVLFEGLGVRNIGEWKCYMIYILGIRQNLFRYSKNRSSIENGEPITIEDLIKYNLNLNKSAIKQI
jgi:hypothetical protein